MIPIIETSPASLLLVAMLAYLLGSVPFGILVARLFGLGDLRTVGSGNIGATNVLRTGNKFAAFLTLFFDAGKGAIAVIVAGLVFGKDAAQVAAFFAFLGHLFPLWLGFNGGKGVATFLGTLLALNFIGGLLVCLSWLVIAALFRYSSLAALLCAATAPIWLWGQGAEDTVLLAILLMTLIWLRHAENIRRLMAGTETKIGQKG